ncbi:tetratricopeptide repeat-containing diguanylate cyclase [uncultured Aquincola sp.]|uniref:tetratricopeptide repeat-containing diguanylate cyclase n=1 Tax=uncultured Aquincola sp. TaxID=886556 RepID=UPI0032B2CA3F
MYSKFRLLAMLLALHAPPLLAHPAAELLARSRQALGTHPETSRALAEQALDTLAREPDADLQLRARGLLCDYQTERDLAAAQAQAGLMRNQLRFARRPGAEAAVLICEGGIEEARGASARALELLERAVASAQQAADEELMADALFQRGYLRGVQGELATGLADMRAAMALYDKLQQTQQAQNTLNGIAVLFNRMGDAAQARAYLESSLRLQREAGRVREQMVTLHNLGRTLENMGEWAEAHKAFEEALQLARKLDYPRGEAYALRGLASVRNARGAPAEALALLDLAAPMQEDTPDARLQAQSLLQRGIALRQLHRPAEAAGVLRQALAIFEQADSLAEQVSTRAQLAGLLHDQGDWRAAYEQQAAWKEASDTLLKRQLDQRYATLKIEFNSAAKERENELLLRDKAAADAALAHERRIGTLKLVVLLLATALAALLAVLAWRQRCSGRAMRELAMTDELTALPNRRHLLAQLEAALRAGNRQGALMILDLDHFKRFNDLRGHLVGDEVLRAVAAVLRQAAQRPAVVGRLGGEEFALWLPRADIVRAAEVAEQLRRQVQSIDTRAWELDGSPITVSIGLSLAEREDDVSSLLRRADEALYAAKAAGRNRVVARTGLSGALAAQEAEAAIGAARHLPTMPAALPQGAAASGSTGA